MFDWITHNIIQQLLKPCIIQYYFESPKLILLHSNLLYFLVVPNLEVNFPEFHIIFEIIENLV